MKQTIPPSGPGRQVRAGGPIHWAHKVRRVVTPDAGAWERAGEILGAIRRKEPHLRSKIPTVGNDLLIALSARQIGATVVTHNARDFDLLRRYVRFNLHILS